MEAVAGVIDAVVLLSMYAAYLWVLFQCPPQTRNSSNEAPVVSRWVYNLGGRLRIAAIVALFTLGGLLLYLTAHPFLDSMLAVAATLGVSPFVFVQWVAPFLSEFPEKVSAFAWARRVTQGADGADEHGVEQHQPVDRAGGDDPADVRVLDAAPPGQVDGLPLRQCPAARDPADDAPNGCRRHAAREHEVRLDGRHDHLRAVARAVRPSLREEVAIAYGLWMAILAVGFIVRGKALLAPEVLLGRGARPDALKRDRPGVRNAARPTSATKRIIEARKESMGPHHSRSTSREGA